MANERQTIHDFELGDIPVITPDMSEKDKELVDAAVKARIEMIKESND